MRCSHEKQPLLTLKNFIQDGRRLPLNPAVWYRGWTAATLMCVPMTVVQFGAARHFERLFALDAPSGETSLPASRRFAAAWLAGGASGAVINPLYVVMLQQQKFGGSLRAVGSRLLKEHGAGVYTRGIGLTVAREAFYSCGYLAVVPILRNAVRDERPEWNQRFGETGVLSVCAAVSGLTAAALTQPIDTVKTLMQSNIGNGARGGDARARAPTGGEGSARLFGGLGYYQTFAVAARENGFFSLWRGLLPRGARIVGATCILSYVNERAGETIIHWRAKDEERALA